MRSMVRAISWAAVLCAACSQGTGTVMLGGSGDAGGGRDVVTSRDVVTPRDTVSTTDLGAPRDAVAPPSDVVAAGDVMSRYDTGGTPGGDCSVATCAARPDGCGPMERCNNGLDDNCDGVVDEGCPCIPGTVQDCFLGPPGHRAVGACRDGTQRCVGTGEFGTWNRCESGISPGAEACNGLDDNCDGCADEGLCCGGELRCPGPSDTRIPEGHPFAPYALRGSDFFTGTARSWHWDVRGGPCDTLLPHPTFTVAGAEGRNILFTPTLSGDYTVTLTITTLAGERLVCTFVVHIAGPGLRVEMCWDTSTTNDVDLYVHDPRNTGAWFDSAGPVMAGVNNNSCNWSNCEAVIRGSRGRVSWGFADSGLDVCNRGPHGDDWAALGHCANPRLDIDNNLSKASGLGENVNVDTPRDGERYRIMAHNWTGRAAHPLVNVYCGGHLRATMGAPPDVLPDFTGESGSTSVGTMWRAADVTVHVDARGVTTGCDVAPLHPTGSTSGYFVTRRDPSY